MEVLLEMVGLRYYKNVAKVKVQMGFKVGLGKKCVDGSITGTGNAKGLACFWTVSLSVECGGK